ncbi:MAG: NADH-quinone oxidoreductase subunit L [Proteobacteria bacterium]|jgi:NADH-quinone oxidoreductase subunit L|nr:NADH-quinone oxidoreductase subunit L [Pseudomonadota bacterium]|tara:strand:+ start:2727 stop:4664 length:1938 start_codon:yes stop_codon:yes gene_type:complete
MSRQILYLAIPLLCLFAAIISGLLGPRIGRVNAHRAAIGGVGLAFILSSIVAIDVYFGNTFNGTVYTWATSGDVRFEVGFLIDPLSAVMMVVVTFVSLMVHIYTIGYMAEDPGYTRFFGYIALFTFAMLMLVMSNNFLQLFFGWEGVGLVSYLLIGFWYERESAIRANLKAFLVNRVGDFGFLLGIGAVLALFGSLDYATVFAAAPSSEGLSLVDPFGNEWHWITVICLLLFVGAMGKSAQVPLHVWLPDSMEGPTPISALIHAATMVTAGIFLIARMSPLFELSRTALSVVLIIGALTALLMALVALVQTDIKRVVAYSTLSQLGYMTVALGASAYSVAIFHLATHAFFKALLFLAAGSVIIAMHHEQDMRRMGGLRKSMPITYLTCVIGSLALAGVPPFAGFFSKDAIIEAVHHSTTPGAGFAYVAVLVGVVLTAFYSFRLVFMTFHGVPRMDEQTRSHLHESPRVVTVPLILLAIPSVIAGALLVEPALTGTLFGSSVVTPEGSVGHGPAGALAMLAHAPFSAPLWLALAGILVAWLFYCARPEWPGWVAKRLRVVVWVLEHKFGFDELYQRVFADGSRALGETLWRWGDRRLIDGLMVNGTAAVVVRASVLFRRVQSGLVYHYAFAMIIGLVGLMSWLLFR